jgi:excisionase family DNA binding protein
MHPEGDDVKEQSILLTRIESAAQLRISMRKLEQLIATKELAARRIGRRVLIERRILEAFARKDH